MSRYRIKKIRSERRDTKYIILTQMQNLTLKSIPVMDPSILFGSFKYNTPKWENYFMKDLAFKSSKAGYEKGLPYHYLIELVNDDYVITMGNPEYSYSFFLQELVDKQIIPQVYKYSVLIGILENFTYDTLAEKRLWEQLSHRLLVPLIRRYEKVDRYKVVYLDDIINWELLEEKRKSGEIDYNIMKAKYFMKDDLEREIKNSISGIQTK